MDTDTKYRVNTIWYDFYSEDGAVLHRGNKFLDTITINHSIDTVPTMSIRVPMSEIPQNYHLNRCEVKVFIGNKYVFYGIVDSYEVDYEKYSTTLNLSHIVAKHRKDFMPVNLIVKNMPLKNLYDNMDFNISGFKYIFSDKAAATRIEYTFSSENKLLAIDDALSQTEDIHWRVALKDEKVVEFSEMGFQTPVIFSQVRASLDECLDRQDKLLYPTMLTEPKLTIDFTDHYNRVVVLCGDIGEGVVHLTLKNIYEDTSLQNPNFPVGMYDLNVNQQPEPEYESEDTGSSLNVGSYPAVSGNNDTTSTVTEGEAWKDVASTIF